MQETAARPPACTCITIPGMNFWLVSTVRDGQKVFEVGRYSDGKRESLFSAPNKTGTQVFLKIKVDGNETATFYYSRDGQQWDKIGDGGLLRRQLARPARRPRRRPRPRMGRPQPPQRLDRNHVRCLCGPGRRAALAKRGLRLRQGDEKSLVASPHYS